MRLGLCAAYWSVCIHRRYKHATAAAAAFRPIQLAPGRRRLGCCIQCILDSTEQQLAANIHQHIQLLQSDRNTRRHDKLEYYYVCWRPQLIDMQQWHPFTASYLSTSVINRYFLPIEVLHVDT